MTLFLAIRRTTPRIGTSFIKSACACNRDGRPPAGKGGSPSCLVKPPCGPTLPRPAKMVKTAARGWTKYWSHSRIFPIQETHNWNNLTTLNNDYDHDHDHDYECSVYSPRLPRPPRLVDFGLACPVKKKPSPSIPGQYALRSYQCTMGL